jgi:hypothetical protein
VPQFGFGHHECPQAETEAAVELNLTRPSAIPDRPGALLIHVSESSPNTRVDIYLFPNQHPYISVYLLHDSDSAGSLYVDTSGKSSESAVLPGFYRGIRCTQESQNVIDGFQERHMSDGIR